MLARYFFCVALIVAAVLSMVQPVFAGWMGYVVGPYCSERIVSAAPIDTWEDFRLAAFVKVGTCGYENCFDSGSTIGSVVGTCTYGSQRVFNSVNTVLTCDSPLVPSADGSQCTNASPPPPPPPSTCTVYPVSSFVESMSGAGDQPLQACMQNCLFNTGSGMSWGVAPNRQWASSGRSTGEFCATNTAAASSANDPACPAGESLNASGVCAPLAMCPYDETIYAINVNCHPALCPTDVSLYASSPLCPAPPASAVPVVVDCAATPNDPICAGAASGTAPTITGTPGTSGVYQAPTMAPLGISGGTQSGDITIENCMQNASGGVVCVDASTTTGEGVELDGVADNVPLGDKVVNIGTITPVLVGTSGSCPAPSPMVLHGHTYYFDWTTYCNFAAWIRPVLLAFAWLAAAGILVGGFVA